MNPSANHRSLIYSTIIQGTRPMTRADYECEVCGREYFSCTCFGLPAYAGADPSLYNRENEDGDRR